jgi:hypothetical protein
VPTREELPRLASFFPIVDIAAEADGPGDAWGSEAEAEEEEEEEGGEVDGSGGGGGGRLPPRHGRAVRPISVRPVPTRPSAASEKDT